MSLLGQRVAHLFECRYFDTCIREACVQLEHDIRRFSGTDVYGNELVELFIDKARSCKRTLESHLRSFRRSTLQRKYILIACVIAVTLGIPLGLISLYGAAMAYDVHRVNSLCAKLVSGTSLDEARRFASNVGLERFMPPFPDDEPYGSYDATENNWYFSIPVAMEYGDERCSIYHDMHEVLKAEMEWL